MAGRSAPSTTSSRSAPPRSRPRFPDVVRHAETPLVRTAPGAAVPARARGPRAGDHGRASTGEGADELFWGYDLFKEVALRELHATRSRARAGDARRLYPYLGGGGRGAGPAWRRFLLETGGRDDPLASHLTRAAGDRHGEGLLPARGRGRAGRRDRSLERLRARAAATGSGAGARSSARPGSSSTTLLEPYLLAAQGDRVAMAHGVEGRYPFLDHRVFAPCRRTCRPSASSTGSTTRSRCASWPRSCCRRRSRARPKQPYRAPEVAPFFGPGAPDGSRSCCRPAALDAAGLWDAGRVEGLVRRCRAGRATGHARGDGAGRRSSRRSSGTARSAGRARALPGRDRRRRASESTARRSTQQRR